MSTASWVANLMTEPDFGDVRLDKRLLLLLDQLAAQPTASLPQACGDWKNTKAAYRFLNSEKVTPKGIRDTPYFQTWRRLLGEDRILALTDTTDLDLSSKPQMQGVGPLGAKKTQGLKVHSVLLATTSGVPLGLAAQNVWARDPAKTGQSKNWRKRPLEDKGKPQMAHRAGRNRKSRAGRTVRSFSLATAKPICFPCSPPPEDRKPIFWFAPPKWCIRLMLRNFRRALALPPNPACVWLYGAACGPNGRDAYAGSIKRSLSLSPLRPVPMSRSVCPSEPATAASSTRVQSSSDTPHTWAGTQTPSAGGLNKITAHRSLGGR